MAAHDEVERTSVWRSRTFVEPFLLTLAGPIAITFAVYVVGIGVSGSCDAGEGCDYTHMRDALRYLLVLALSLFFTGFVIGVSSPNSGVAGRAMLVGVVTLAVTTSVLIMASDASRNRLDARQAVDDLLAAGLVAVALLVPIAFGFGVGRVLKIALRRAHG